MEFKFNLFLLVRYIIYVMIVNWCDMALISYIIKPGTYVVDDMESFVFFTKYILIAIFFAWLIPYLEEIIRKYIHISFQVKEQNENDHSKKS